MATHNDKGKEGERIARQYLSDHGYLILESNWRFGHLEADIIAYKDNLVVFVEVKTRSTDWYGAPEEFVDLKKRQAYIRLANAYIVQKNRPEEVRFDIIAVVTGHDDPKINHIVGAYTTVG